LTKFPTKSISLTADHHLNWFIKQQKWVHKWARSVIDLIPT